MIRHIYQHLFDCGYLKRGDTVLDPFAGVALGALHAMQRGLSWIGVELEEKFVALGQQNIDLWNARYGPHLPNWGSAVLLQGDSRCLGEVAGEAGGLVSSPPYAESVKGNMGASWKETDKRNPTKEHYKRYPGLRLGQSAMQSYSTNPANLGNMPAGDPGDRHGVDAVIGSPPYQEQVVRKRDPGKDGFDQGTTQGKHAFDEYGQTPGQLAAMPPGPEPGQVADGLDAVIASPPYEGSEGTPSGGRLQALSGGTLGSAAQKEYGMTANYGNSDGQLGHTTGPTFWSAARVIVQQCYHVLKPGAVAVWVVKRFVRDKQIVPFSQQWADLCQSCGFELLHWHRAMLVEDGGTQLGLMGDDKRKVKKRYSFFRRLHAQKYPHLEIEWEDVLCTIRR